MKEARRNEGDRRPPRLFVVEGADSTAVRTCAGELATALAGLGEPAQVIGGRTPNASAQAREALAAGLSVVVQGGWWEPLIGPIPAVELHQAAVQRWTPLQPDRMFVTDLLDGPASREKRRRAERYRDLIRAAGETGVLLKGSALPAEQVRSLKRAPTARRLGRALPTLDSTVMPVPQKTLPTRVQAPQPSALLDLYWRFAAERQEIFFRRLEAASPPWTTDPVLQTYRFTNAYRASDRVSQYLIRQVIYDQDRSFEETVFRVLLFKFFNRIDTWERLKEEVGEPEWRTYRYDRYDACLSRALEEGRRVFSAAYIMPSGGPRDVLGRKHRSLLQLLEFMMNDKLPDQLTKAGSMAAAYRLLLSYPMLGPFLAYQYVTDLNYSRHLDFSEMEFVMPGPGALDGLAKTFVHFGDRSPAEVIGWVAGQQDEAFERLGLNFRTLWGRKLQLIDCQNLFCEISKYTRASHPEVLGVSGRTRIKQTFVALDEPVRVWYPPKWGLNDRLPGKRECT